MRSVLALLVELESLLLCVPDLVTAICLPPFPCVAACSSSGVLVHLEAPSLYFASEATMGKAVHHEYDQEEQHKVGWQRNITWERESIWKSQASWKM